MKTLTLISVLFMFAGCASYKKSVLEEHRGDWKCYEKYCYKTMRKLNGIAELR